MDDQNIPDDIMDDTTTLAIAVAELTKRAIGPEGRVRRMTDEADISLIRAAFIARFAEVATGLVNGND